MTLELKKKKSLLQFLKYALRFIGSIAAIILLYVVSALLLSFLSTSPERHDCELKNIAYVTTNGVHLEIVMPVEIIEEPLKSSLNIPSGTKFVSFGWGDKGFFLKTPTWADLTFGTAFSALFLKTESAMHTTFFRGAQDYWQALNLCPKQLESLNTFISPSFSRDHFGKLRLIPDAGYGSNDRFYEACDYYTLFYTCNTWVNDALKQAEVSTSIWTPFDFGVLYHVGNPQENNR